MKRIALIALAAMIATPALASKGRSQTAPPDATASSEQTASADKTERKTCRTYQTTGSHAKPERLCMTREEWRKFDDGE
ncbi:MAG TPA: hypothetical protein VFW19_00040 [Allosphingosinicella sp.]|nr:hypothetical protein [Allosphingosinicella sp.]